MIKHLVLWKLDDSYNSKEKQNIKEELKSRLMGLSGVITELNAIAVQFNSEETPETNYDIVLDSDFNSVEDLNKYQVHPEHKKVGAYLKTLKVQRSCIDYEY